MMTKNNILMQNINTIICFHWSKPNQHKCPIIHHFPHHRDCVFSYAEKVIFISLKSGNETR